MLSMRRVRDWLSGRKDSTHDSSNDSTDDATKVEISVQFSNRSKEWVFKLSPDDTIKDLKLEIFKEYRIPTSEQILHMKRHDQDVELSDENILELYHGKIINLKLRPQGDDAWTIYVKYTKDSPVSVRVKPTEKLDMVRVRIFDPRVVLFDRQTSNTYDCDQTIQVLLKNNDMVYAQRDHSKVDLPSEDDDDGLDKLHKLHGDIKINGARSAVSDKSRMSVHDHNELLQEELENKKSAIHEEFHFIREVCSKLNITWDSITYKHKIKERIDAINLQAKEASKLTDEVRRLNGTVHEKEVVITELKESNAKLSSISGMSEDVLKTELKQSESLIVQLKEQIERQKTTISEQNHNLDDLHALFETLKTEMSTSTSHFDSILLKNATRLQEIETEKEELRVKLHESVEKFDLMKQKHDEVNRKNVDLQRVNVEVLGANRTSNENLTEVRRQLETMKHQNNLSLQKVQDLEKNIGEQLNENRTDKEKLTTLQEKYENAMKLIRNHEDDNRKTEIELRRLKGVEAQYASIDKTQDVQLQTANGLIKLKDEEINKLHVELGNVKSEIRHLKAQENVHKDSIARLTKENGDLHDTLKKSKRESTSVAKSESTTMLPFNVFSSRQPVEVESESALPQSEYSRRKPSARHSTTDDDNDYFKHYDTNDMDSHGDQASVHFAHLLARLRGLVGEKPPIELVEDLVSVIEEHITNELAQQALLKRIIPGYTHSIYSMTFHDLLYDYLLQNDSSSSLYHQLRRLNEEGIENGTEV
jgi:hypothetical protein